VILHDSVESLIEQGVKDPTTGEKIVVDTIISEWMGYFLLSEGVLESVFRARDEWLIKDGTGIVFPSHCVMWLGLFTDRIHTEFWNDVYGVDMSPVNAYIGERDWDRKFPSIESIPSECLLSQKAPCHFIDCVRDSIPHVVKFTDTFSLKVAQTGPWHGFAGFFTVYFDPEVGLKKKTFQEIVDAGDSNQISSLTTAPFDTKNRDTHWHHSLLLTGPSQAKEGDVVSGSIEWEPNHHEPRYFNCSLTWKQNDGPQATRTWFKC